MEGKNAYGGKRSSVGVLAGPSWETEPRKLSEAHTYLKASSLGGDGTEELSCVRECPEFTALTKGWTGESSATDLVYTRGIQLH